MHTRWLAALALVLGAVEVCPAVCRADEVPPRPASDWIGVELTPVSLGFGTAPPYGEAPRRLQGGPGATLVLLRQSWAHAYVGFSNDGP